MLFTKKLNWKSLPLPAAGLASLLIAFSFLVFLFIHIFSEGSGGLNWNFFTNFASRFPSRAGIYSAWMGSLWLLGLTALISIPIGIFSALYLEEIAAKNAFTNFIRGNIANLAGVPSIVYGLLGLALFVRILGFGSSLMAGACTLSLLILPVIIMASIEALRTVPKKLREAAFGVGASPMQVLFEHTLPQAVPGMITGIILALSRSLGETAPLIAVGALAFAAFLPESMMDQFTSLSIQIFNWASRPKMEFQELAATAIIVILSITFLMNFVAMILRWRLSFRKAMN